MTVRNVSRGTVLKFEIPTGLQPGHKFQIYAPKSSTEYVVRKVATGETAGKEVKVKFPASDSYFNTIIPRGKKVGDEFFVEIPSAQGMSTESEELSSSSDSSEDDSSESEIDDEIVDQIRDVFDFFDDGSGELSEKEFANAVRAFGDDPTESEVHKVFQSANLDGGEGLSIESFIRYVKRDIHRKLHKVDYDRYNALLDGFVTYSNDEDEIGEEELMAIFDKALGLEISEEESFALISFLSNETSENSGMGAIRFKRILRIASSSKAQKEVDTATKNILAKIGHSLASTSPLDFLHCQAGMPSFCRPSICAVAYKSPHNGIQEMMKSISRKSMLSVAGESSLTRQEIRHTIDQYPLFYGASIRFDKAVGIDPPDSEVADYIQKRYAYVALYYQDPSDSKADCFIGNIQREDVTWHANEYDCWKFKIPEDKRGERHTYFLRSDWPRGHAKEGKAMDYKNISLLVELTAVVHSPSDDDTITHELSFGFCQIPILELIPKQATSGNFELRKSFMTGTPRNPLPMAPDPERRLQLKRGLSLYRPKSESVCIFKVSLYRGMKPAARLKMNDLPATVIATENQADAIRLYCALRKSEASQNVDPECNIAVKLFPKILGSLRLFRTFLKEWQKVAQSVGYRSSMNNFTDKILAAFCKSVLCVWPSLSKGNDAVEVSAESLSFNGGIWSGGESAPADGENAESSLFKPFHIRELQ